MDSKGQRACAGLPDADAWAWTRTMGGFEGAPFPVPEMARAMGMEGTNVPWPSRTAAVHMLGNSMLAAVTARIMCRALWAIGARPEVGDPWETGAAQAELTRDARAERTATQKTLTTMWARDRGR